MNRSKSEATRSIDIVNGGLWKNILMFAIPLAVSSVLQQLFNSVDVAVVGKFATSQDQAAVGCTGALINLMINLFVGISVGANAVSYTHLDVYKRQDVNIDELLVVTFTRAAASEMKERVRAVSYTHLDVYKRQGLGQWAIIHL